MDHTKNVMKIIGAGLFFLNSIGLVLLIFIYGSGSLDIFWGLTGHFAYLGSLLIADIFLSAIVFILPQNWSQKE